jgi:hypothetical protein
MLINGQPDGSGFSQIRKFAKTPPAGYFLFVCAALRATRGGLPGLLAAFPGVSNIEKVDHLEHDVRSIQFLCGPEALACLDRGP